MKDHVHGPNCNHGHNPKKAEVAKQDTSLAPHIPVLRAFHKAGKKSVGAWPTITWVSPPAPKPVVRDAPPAAAG
jgi:hypothetical protein